MTTKEQVLEELGRFAERCPERKIVCLDNNDTPVFINCVEYDEDEPSQYILTEYEVGERDMTVVKLIECLKEYSADDLEGEETEVLVRLEEDECPRYLDDSSGSIFFEHTVGSEKVIAFRYGDEAETDYDFFDDVN